MTIPKMMKAAVIVEPGKIEVQDVPVPEVTPGMGMMQL